MNEEDAINNLIDKMRFRSYNKVKSVVLKKFPNTDKDKLRGIINKRLHDKRISNQQKRIYQVKIFSRFRNAYFTDIYDNLEGNSPRYWQIFINTNTRFAVAYPLDSKTKDAIHANLVQFVNDHHPRKITSDEEAGLVAKINSDYLKANNCGLFIVQERNHSTLGIIDRFIRTLRDMNRPVEKPLRSQSTDDQYKHISATKMRELLYWHNNTIQPATGHTPNEMMNNPELENDYIKRCLTNQARQIGITDFKLHKGDLVRIIFGRRSFDKKRYNVSRECYKIEDILGNIYTIIANDGTTRNLPRWRLIKVDDNENKRIGQTLGSDKGVVDEVIQRVSANKIKVRFKMPDGSRYVKDINLSELRMPFPQIPSKYETNTV